MPSAPSTRCVVFTNWAGNQRCRPAVVHVPDSELEVVRVLGLAARERARVKVVGSGHSFSDVACTDGHMIRLDRMDRLLDVDRKACRVTVQAGIRLRVLNDQLAQLGLALGNLGSISEQTIAGAISTGTHGTGIRFGSLSTLVQSMRLVRADGEVLDLTRSDGDMFEAARLGLGCLGVITRVTLRCEPAFDLEEEAYCLRFEEAIERMPALVDGQDHVKLWWLPHTGRVFVVAMRRVPPRHDRGRIRHALRGGAEALVNGGLFSALLRLGALAPATVPVINRAVSKAYFRPRRRIDRSDRLFNLTMPPVHREVEYGIPRDMAPLALRRLRELVHSLRLAVNFVVEARFVARDSILLSPSFQRDSCQLGAYMAPHPHRAIYFDAFETLCWQLDGRPHWGKEFDVGPKGLSQRFPGYRRFLSVRRAVDPHNRFSNRFTRRVFGD